ncbi:MAG: amidohydrolase [Cyanobacteria bacterium P01_A01_bin.105]
MAFTLAPNTPVGSARLRPSVEALQPELVAWRRALHQRPELGFEEVHTAAFIEQQLTDWGVTYRSGIAKTGIVATLPGQRPGPVLAIRADMDALPIQELNAVPYRSQHEGKMHACGHDGHVAIALGTVHHLHHHNDFAGTVKVIFQPAEEGPGGAQPMIEAGVLDQPHVDAVIGLHLWNNLPLGTVGVRNGPLMAATEYFHCTITGRGGHGAIPQQTVDAIVVAAEVVGAVQTIVSRNLNPLESAVVTLGEFHAGTAVNVIANSARLSGTVRYFNPDHGDLIPQRLEQIISGICQAHGASYQLDYHKLYPPVVNHPDLADLVRGAARFVVETPAGVVPDCQTMGGEDMSFFLQARPGCYFFLGAANLSRGLAYPHHHPRFDFDEAALGMGVEIFLRCVEAYGDA